MGRMHTKPPRVIAPNDVDKDLKNGKALLGCQVPVVVASPFSKEDVNNPRINSVLYDHTSVLKFIEWQYGLPPLTKRDASDEIGNLASKLDFSNLDPTVPSLPVVNKVNAKGCKTSVLVDGHENGNADMLALLKSEGMESWPVAHER